MSSNYDRNLINYVKDFKVPKKVPKYEDKHILLPIQNIKKNDDAKINPNPNIKHKTNKKRKVTSVAKGNYKTTKASNHNNRQNSTKVSFNNKNRRENENKNYNNYNMINFESEIPIKNEIKEKEYKDKKEKKKKIEKKEKEKKEKKEYLHKMLIQVKDQNLFLKNELSNKDVEIEKYKKKYHNQEIMIKDLELIINELENNNKPIDINNYNSVISLSDDFKDDILYDDGLQDELALQAVDQQIMDELCPNPDQMTYEQLLQLEDNVGSVNKGLTSEQIDNLPNKRFKKEKNREFFQCIICMEEFQEKEKVKVLPCAHIFHINCIKQWLLKQKTCPFCKSEIG